MSLPYLHHIDVRLARTHERQPRYYATFCVGQEEYRFSMLNDTPATAHLDGLAKHFIIRCWRQRWLPSRFAVCPWTNPSDQRIPDAGGPATPDECRSLEVMLNSDEFQTIPLQLLDFLRQHNR